MLNCGTSCSWKANKVAFNSKCLPSVAHVSRFMWVNLWSGKQSHVYSGVIKDTAIRYINQAAKKILGNCVGHN